MRLIITESYEQSARLAAADITEIVKAKPKALLGLATGSTPISVYRYMVEDAKHDVDYTQVRTLNLDEYIGLAGEDENSYLYFMRQHLLDPCGIPMEHVMIPNGLGEVEAELRRLNEFADANPIDVQLLSVGVNGHIGFNEPDNRFYDHYHTVTLTERTRQSNSRLFHSIDEVPKAAITMGVGGIMRAAKIVFLATGEEKRAAMRAILEDGDVTPFNQGTVLKLHRDCVIYLDRQTAVGIKPAAYVSVQYAEEAGGNTI